MMMWSVVCVCTYCMYADFMYIHKVTANLCGMFRTGGRDTMEKTGPEGQDDLGFNLDS